MGPVSGFVLEYPDEPSLYIAGDTIWCPEVQSALEKYQPRVIICFAGAARFSSGDPITMGTEDIYKVCKQVPNARVIIAHLEAWNHCSLSRQDLKKFIKAESLMEQVLIPDDGGWMNFYIIILVLLF
jgi:L-ascorbate metabolism protein UlaG (beta-lactamase superfamily)